MANVRLQHRPELPLDNWHVLEDCFRVVSRLEAHCTAGLQHEEDWTELLDVLDAFEEEEGPNVN